MQVLFSVTGFNSRYGPQVDQLTLIVRYVLPCGPVKKFIKFLDVDGHTAEQLVDSLLEFLKTNYIDIKDCRGQSYDNASNMSGKYRGLQARIEEINPYAEYIPCFAHSLNLVAKCAPDCCLEASLFFDFVESVYTFFSHFYQSMTPSCKSIRKC